MLKFTTLVDWMLAILFFKKIQKNNAYQGRNKINLHNLENPRF